MGGRFLHVAVAIHKLGYGFGDTVATGYDGSYSHRFLVENNLDVRVSGGLQNSNQACFIKPLVLNTWSFSIKS